MARITPRSINIRYVERSKNHVDTASEYCLAMLNSYAAGVEDYKKINMEPPDLYYNHGAKLTAILEAFERINQLLDEILKEL